MADHPDDSSGVAAARETFFVLGSIGLVVAALYLGQRIFVPLALAVLLTLVLGPVVIWLERRGLGRFPAVLLASVFAFLLWFIFPFYSAYCSGRVENSTNLKGFNA